MTNKEKELMQDLINQASNKVELLQKIVIEKAVELERLKEDAHNLITKQEQEIDRLKVEYSKLQNQFAQYQMASDKEIATQVKQAKIDVLNELRERVETAIDTYFNKDGGGYYLAEYAMNDIDEMIEELKK